jgi:hypothetical protein
MLSASADGGSSKRNGVAEQFSTAPDPREQDEAGRRVFVAGFSVLGVQEILQINAKQNITELPFCSALPVAAV